MGIRKIGKKTVERDIEEEFCDNCGATIPEGQYPEIVVDLQRDEWGDSQTMTFCGFACLAEWASKEDGGARVERGQRGGASPLKSLDQATDLIRDLLEYHFDKGRQITFASWREMVPEPLRDGEPTPRHRKGDMTIVIRVEVP